MNELSVRQGVRFASLEESSQVLMTKLDENRQVFSKELESQTSILTKLQKEEHEKTRVAIQQVIQGTWDFNIASGVARSGNLVNDAHVAVEIKVRDTYHLLIIHNAHY